MKFSNRVKAIQISAIKQMPVLAQQYPGAISLGQGIPSFATPAFVTDAVGEYVRKIPGSGKYSLQPGTTELREAVALDVQERTGAVYDPSTQIAITCGAMEALAITLSALVERGDKVALPAPCYASHMEHVLFAEGNPVFFPLIDGQAHSDPIDRGDAGWSADLDALAKICREEAIRVIVISNPSNPTGMVLSRQDMERIVQIVRDSGATLVADETYDFLTYDGINFESFASFPEIRDQLVLINSFSKRFCMTGYRVGYVCAPQELIEQVLKVHDAFAICAPTVSQYGAQIALKYSRESSGVAAVFAAMVRTELQRRRDLLCSGLLELPGFCRAAKPQGAYYVFARLSDQILQASWWTTSLGLAEKILREAGVIVIPGSAFGPAGENYVRFSFGAEERDIEEALKRVERWLARLVNNPG
jgi:aminotransferase